MEYQILKVNYDKMSSSVEQHGGKDCFGNFNQWGDIFCIIDKYANQATREITDVLEDNEVTGPEPKPVFLD